MIVTFTRETNFTGRNGYHKCSGMDLTVLGHNESVMLAPLTSRGVIGRCDIEVPLEDLPELIVQLQAIIDGPLDTDLVAYLKAIAGGPLLASTVHNAISSGESGGLDTNDRVAKWNALVARHGREEADRLVRAWIAKPYPLPKG